VIAMPLNHPLRPGDRVVITALPDGFIYHVETREGSIRSSDIKVRSFQDTLGRIEKICTFLDDQSAPGSNSSLQ